MEAVHFDGALGTEVGLENILQTLGGIDVHVQSRRFVEHFGIRVQHSQGHVFSEKANTDTNRRREREREKWCVKQRNRSKPNTLERRVWGF